jgi:hypothetical protein
MRDDPTLTQKLRSALRRATGGDMSQPETQTGTTTLRLALRARLHKGGIGIMSRDLGTSIASLEAFATSNAKLPAETMNKLAKYIFGETASFDAASDRLRRAKPQAQPMGIVPPPVVPHELPYYQSPEASRWRPRANPDPTTRPAPLVRPGWAKD